MKIAFILPSLEPTGPNLVAQDLIRGLVSKSIEVRVFYLTDLPNTIEFMCPIEKIGFSKKTDFSKFDIVHSHCLRPDIYNFLYNKVRPRVSTIHTYMYKDLSDFYPKPLAFLAEKTWSYILSKYDKVVSLTNDAKTYYERYINTSKLEVVYNSKSIDPLKILDEEYSKELEVLKEKYIVLGMNVALIYRKGIDIVIKTLKDLENCCLYVIGDGNYREELIEIAKAEGVYDRCFFKGFQKDGYLFIPYYDIYVMASRAEGFGLCMVEAAQQRSLIACSKLLVFEEVFDDESVSFFDLADPLSFKIAIDSLITNKDIYKENVYKLYEKKLSLNTFVEKYLEVYKKIIHQ